MWSSVVAVLAATCVVTALLLPRLRDAWLGPPPSLPAAMPADVRRRVLKGRAVSALAPHLPIWLLRYSYDAEGRRDTPAASADPVEERDMTTPGATGAPLPARLYTPSAARVGKTGANGRGPLPPPLLLYIHGGGFTIGSLASHAPTCRALAAALGWPVLAVTYRRAPEHPYPAAALDVLATYTHVAAHAAEFGLRSGAPRIVVAGDSAGGQLALELGLRLRDASRGKDGGGRGLAGMGAGALPLARPLPPPPPPILLAPIYPVVNFTSMLPSKTRYAFGFGALTLGLARVFGRAYAWPTKQAAALNAQDAYLNPDLQTDLSGLPPILLATAEFDILHDEGVAFADTARARGATVEHLELHGNVHACVQGLARSPSNRAALAAVAGRIKAMVEGGK